MTFEQFQAAVRSERIPMLLLVHGEESYLVDQAGRLVVNTVVAAPCQCSPATAW
jgi:hypothetical protein